MTTQLPTLQRPRAVTRKRDEQVRRKVRSIARLGNLADLRYRPALQSLARLMLLGDRLYLTLKDSDLVKEDGSAIGALESYVRICNSTGTLLKSLGLLPTSILPDDRAGSLDAVFERISKVRKVREGADDGEHAQARAE